MLCSHILPFRNSCVPPSRACLPSTPRPSDAPSLGIESEGPGHMPCTDRGLLTQSGATRWGRPFMQTTEHRGGGRAALDGAQMARTCSTD